MIDTATKKPLRVEVSTGGRAFLWLSMEQLPLVQTLLDSHGIRYWPDESSYAFEDDPEVTVITFYYETDPALVQRLLDDLP